jgi:hypothetical protein
MQFRFRHLVLSPFLIVAPYRFLYVLSEAVRARTTSTDGYYLVYATLECSIVRILSLWPIDFPVLMSMRRGFIALGSSCGRRQVRYVGLHCLRRNRAVLYVGRAVLNTDRAVFKLFAALDDLGF